MPLETLSVVNRASARSRPGKGLDPFFAPSNVAVVGATDKPGSVGRTVLQNLLKGSRGGQLYAVNPKRSEVLGVPAFSDVRHLPEPVDLAIIVTPAVTVPGIIGDCVDAGVKAAVVISAGFRERGAEGADLEAQIREQLERGSMRLIGPNCLGIMNPVIG
ncbi:MAG TPA: CoA-binding protein, partial [Terriglobales bacterium]|nr:CoA-binding protein [Terriglobales bacterium]